MDCLSRPDERAWTALAPRGRHLALQPEPPATGTTAANPDTEYAIERQLATRSSVHENPGPVPNNLIRFFYCELGARGCAGHGG
jgi:hypothetical protein